MIREEYEIILMARLGYGVIRLSDRHTVFYGNNRAECLDWIARELQKVSK